ncbi:MAG TPA: glycosyltransferase [Chitinophagaceae bacterium]|nr:glycosyltransferase [Chitinophagaceae bacterium]
MNKRVCVILVTYNRVDTLRQALANLKKQTYSPESIVIVDNNSSDSTKLFLGDASKDKSTLATSLSENIGYAGGISHGIAYAKKYSEYDYFWIMDDDSLQDPQALSQLVQASEESGYAIIGSKGFNIKHGVKHEIEATGEIRDVDFILIDGALLKSDIVAAVGTPDQKYFMMCEDYEYCKRLKRNGYKIGIVKTPPVNRLHLGGGGQFNKNTLWRGYYHSRNHLLILKQYFSFGGLYGYIITQLKFIIAAAILAPDRFKRVKLRMLGIWHGLKGVDGKTLDPATLKF